eukprot:Clim_evm2s197 gene=Clim_evmTU2s197
MDPTNVEPDSSNLDGPSPLWQSNHHNPPTFEDVLNDDSAAGMRRRQRFMSKLRRKSSKNQMDGMALPEDYSVSASSGKRSPSKYSKRSVRFGWVLVFLLLITGLTTTLLLYHSEIDSEQKKRNQLCIQFGEELAQSVGEATRFLEQLYDDHRAWSTSIGSTAMTYDQFQVYFDIAIEARELLFSFGVARFLRQGEIAAFEKEANELLPGANGDLFVKDFDGNPVVDAPGNDFYTPVLYALPSGKPQMTDLSQNPERKAAISTAIRTGSVQATEALPIIEGGTASVLYHAVYNPNLDLDTATESQREEYVESVIAGAIRYDVFFEDLLLNVEYEDLRFILVDSGMNKDTVNTVVIVDGVNGAWDVSLFGDCDLPDCQDPAEVFNGESTFTAGERVSKVTVENGLSSRNWVLFIQCAQAFDDEASSEAATIIVVVGVAVTVFLILCVVMFIFQIQKNDLWKAHEEQILRRHLAEAANSSKRQFMNYVFHEVRVPFNNIYLGLQIMCDDKTVSSVPSLHDACIDMMESADVVRHTLNDVLDMHKIETGYFELNRGLFSLNTFFVTTCKLFQQAAHEKNITIKTEIEGVVEKMDCIVDGDERRLKQCLGNLLSNGIKYSPLGSNLRVCLRVTEVDRSLGVGSSTSTVCSDSPNKANSFEEVPDNQSKWCFKVRATRKGAHKYKSARSPSTEQALKCPSKGASHTSVDMDAIYTVPPDDEKTDQLSVPEHTQRLGKGAAKVKMLGRESIAGPARDMGNVLVEVTVIDEGPGIPEAEMALLFRPYTQIISGKNEHIGTGLGLSITRAIIEQHGGTIQVESREGAGSAFAFEIPMSAEIVPLSVAVENVKANSEQRAHSCTERLQQAQAQDTLVRTFNALPHPDATDHALSTDGRDQDCAAAKCTAAVKRQQSNSTATVATLSDAMVNPAVSEAGPQATTDTAVITVGVPTPVTLKTDEPTRGLAPVQSSDKLSAARHRMRVAVAEDNVITRRAMTRILNQLGIASPLLYINGQEIIDYAEQWYQEHAPDQSELSRGPFDLIFMDGSMPVSDGLEATRRLRAMGVQCQIIGFTGHALSSSQQHFLDAGVNMVLIKPASKGTILEHLNHTAESLFPQMVEE